MLLIKANQVAQLTNTESSSTITFPNNSSSKQMPNIRPEVYAMHHNESSTSGFVF